MKKIRINKFLTQANFCSRREADKLIEQGRVRVNFKIAKLGEQISLKDKVTVDGQQIILENDKIYLAFNKPIGVITTTSKKENNTIVDYINYDQRIYPIGRLDVNSSGLILLTSDGDFAQKIMRKESQIEKEYEVLLDKEILNSDIKKLRQGVMINGYKTLPAKVTRLGKKKLRIVIIEGKNRQIRKMCQALGYNVKKLKRMRIGKMELGNLKPGHYQELTPKEISKFFS